MKKRLFTILMAGVLAVSALTACTGKDKSETADKGKDSASSENTATGESTASGSGNEAQSGEKEKVRIVLDWTPNTNHTGLYVAQEKGFFEAAGLEVEIMQPPEGSTTELVGAGGAEFGISFQDTLAPTFASDNSMPVTAVAAVIQHNTSGILSLKSTGIDTPSKMAGHSYAEGAKKFLDAVKQGYEYAIANPDEAADILVKAVPELDPALIKESQNWLKDQYKAEVTQWGYIDPARWDGFYAWLYENQLIEQEIPAGTGFSNDFLPE